MQPTKSFQDPIVVYTQASGKTQGVGDETVATQTQALKPVFDDTQNITSVRAVSDVHSSHASHIHSSHASIGGPLEKLNKDKPINNGFWGTWLCIPRCGRLWSAREDERLFWFVHVPFKSKLTCGFAEISFSTTRLRAEMFSFHHGSSFVLPHFSMHWYLPDPNIGYVEFTFNPTLAARYFREFRSELRCSRSFCPLAPPNKQALSVTLVRPTPCQAFRLTLTHRHRKYLATKQQRGTEASAAPPRRCSSAPSWRRASPWPPRAAADSPRPVAGGPVRGGQRPAPGGGWGLQREASGARQAKGAAPRRAAHTRTEARSPASRVPHARRGLDDRRCLE